MIMADSNTFLSFVRSFASISIAHVYITYTEREKKENKSMDKSSMNVYICQLFSRIRQLLIVPMCISNATSN